MAKLQRLPNGRLLTVGSRLAVACCCAPLPNCCLTPGGGPTSSFTYSQTGYNPCCYAFTDTSTPGSCGTIQHYRWRFNGSLFSTAKNPTYCAVGNGLRNVELEVEDSYGCIDASSQSLYCNSQTLCGCGYDLPDAMILRTSGFLFGGSNQCLKYNGDWIVPRVGGTHNYYLQTVVTGTIMEVLISEASGGSGIVATLQNLSTNPNKLFGVCFDGWCGVTWSFPCPPDCRNFGPTVGTMTSVDMGFCNGGNPSVAVATLESA